MIDSLAEINNLAANFLTGLHIAKAQTITDSDELLHEKEGTVDVDDLRDGFFGEWRARE
ncbi:MAG: hypothetical protein NVS9B14_05750 [Candidatus Acidiferrum sp.]